MLSITLYNLNYYQLNNCFLLVLTIKRDLLRHLNHLNLNLKQIDNLILNWWNQK